MGEPVRVRLTETFVEGHAVADHSMELRDWFAGQALQGLLAGPNAPRPSKSESGEPYAGRLAEEAYLIADALLGRRDRPLRDEAMPAAAPAAPKPGRRGTVRISGNWRNRGKVEWGGAPAIDEAGRLERSVPAIPEEVYQAVEREVAKGAPEGMTFLPDGTQVEWFVDR
jgi:hypothetical protein